MVTKTNAIIFSIVLLIASLAAFAGGITMVTESNSQEPVPESITSLMDTDALDFIGTSSIRTTVQDSVGRVFIAGSDGLFAVHPPGSGVTSDLSSVDENDFIGTSTIDDMAYDAVNNRIYLITRDPDAKFGYYDIAENVVHDLTSVTNLHRTDPYDTMVEYSPEDDAVFIIASEAPGTSFDTDIEYYTRADNTSRNVSEYVQAVALQQINDSNIPTYETMAVDTANNAVYIASIDGDLIQFNLSTNSTAQLSGTGTGNLALTMDGGNVLIYSDDGNVYRWSRTTDSTASVVGLGLAASTDAVIEIEPSGTHFFVAEAATPSAVRVQFDGFGITDLYSIDESDFMASNAILDFTFQDDDDGFIVGNSGLFGFYTPGAEGSESSPLFGVLLGIITGITAIVFIVFMVKNIGRS